MERKNKDFLRKNKGITLIALVVTIVVLLILAAVSISMLGGENGIITQAQKSKDETEQAKVEEIVNVVIGSLIAENQGDTSGITPKDIADKINAEYEQYKNVYAENETSFPTKIIFPEEGDREVDIDLNKNSNNIYNADVSEEDIAPVDIFKYEIISNAETGATTLDSLPTKEAKITGIKEKYCNKGGYTTDTGEKYEDTNYEIILEDGTKITETLVVPYQVEIDGEMYKITEVDLAVYWNDVMISYTLPNVKTIIYPNTVKVISGNKHSFGYKTGWSITEKIILPQNLKTIGKNAFMDCNSLTNIEIPGSVTSIENSAFKGCSKSLTTIIVDADNTIYDSRDNCNAIIETKTNTLLYGCKNTIIPSSVTSIATMAFYDCDSLTSIEIPSSVTSIESGAFYYCNGLKTVNYTGTMAQWQQISGKEELSEVQIICTDGTLNQ